MNTWAAMAMHMVVVIVAAFAYEKGNKDGALGLMLFLVVAFQLGQIAQNNVLIGLKEYQIRKDREKEGGR